MIKAADFYLLLSTIFHQNSCIIQFKCRLVLLVATQQMKCNSNSPLGASRLGTVLLLVSMSHFTCCVATNNATQYWNPNPILILVYRYDAWNSILTFNLMSYHYLLQAVLMLQTYWGYIVSVVKYMYSTCIYNANVLAEGLVFIRFHQYASMPHTCCKLHDQVVINVRYVY